MGQRLEIIQRLDALDLAYNHPILLCGLIAELERTRLVDRVDSLLDGFALKASSDRKLNLDMDESEMATFLETCYRSRELINQIKSEKRQLSAMARKTYKFKLYSNSTNEVTTFSAILKSQRDLRWPGCEIYARLCEINNEYEDKLNDCSMVIENMSLTMQTWL
ncbi:MAG: hypothetical protein Q9227_003659 [Pyrenula ochraceoflavens]